MARNDGTESPGVDIGVPEGGRDTPLKSEYRAFRRAYDLRFFLHLDSVISQIWKRSSLGPYVLRSYFDAVQRPAYAYGVLCGARLAKALDMDSISVCEFGVGGGGGLLALEKAAIEIGRALQIDIEVYGFDTGEGLPKAGDCRDLPYWFYEGFYPMEVDKLKRRLRKAKLVLGHISKTLPDTMHEFERHPLAFCSFDLDYYFSTKDAINVFKGTNDTRLPRVLCYFDDLIGTDSTAHGPHVGQRRAIEEFNNENQNKKISNIYGLQHKRIVRAAWNDLMFVFDDFEHPAYTTPIRQAFEA